MPTVLNMSMKMHIRERKLTNKLTIKKKFYLKVHSFTGKKLRRCFLKSGHKNRSIGLDLLKKPDKLLDNITNEEYKHSHVINA